RLRAAAAPPRAPRGQARDDWQQNCPSTPIDRREKKMSERSRHSDMRVRKSMKGRKALLVERRALPTPERLRRAGADVARGHSGQITMRDSPLERAFARNALTPEQYSAGQKYRHTGITPALPTAWNRSISIASSQSTSARMRGWRRRKANSSIGKDTGRPRKPSARSDPTYWNGRCAGKLRSSRLARH